MCHRVTYRGWRMCSDMPPTIELFERRMREERGWAKDRKLRIFQAAYSSGVSASADTHAGGGALDTEKLDDAGTKIARECGTTSWQRGTPEDTFFDDHNHWIFIGCGDLSGGARVQVTSYKNGGNGLARGGADKSPRVSPIRTCQQALVYYRPKPTPPPEGILGMSKSIYHRYGENQKIASGDFHDVWINKDHHVSVADANPTVTVSGVVRLVGLEPGDWAEVTWRLAEVIGDKTTIKTTRLPTTVLGEAGRKQNGVAVFNGGVPKDQRLRLGVRTNSDTLTIETAEMQGLEA